MATNRAPENPYLAARQEWSERYGSYVKAASAWRIVGILGLSMAVIGFGYAMYLSTQVKLVPYIVEVDKLGTTASTGFPQQIEYADPRALRKNCEKSPIKAEIPPSPAPANASE